MAKVSIEKSLEKIITKDEVIGAAVAVLTKDKADEAAISIKGAPDDVLAMVYMMIQAVANETDSSTEEILEVFSKV